MTPLVSYPKPKTTAGRVFRSLLCCLFLPVPSSFITRLQAADGDWPVYLGDKASTHFSTLTQFNRRNVHRLQVAWTHYSGDARKDNRSQIQCNPLVIAGVVY